MNGSTINRLLKADIVSKELDKSKKELSDFFKNIRSVDQPFIKLKTDKSGKSIYGGIAFFLNSGSARLSCQAVFK